MLKADDLTLFNKKNLLPGEGKGGMPTNVSDIVVAFFLKPQLDYNI